MPDLISFDHDLASEHYHYAFSDDIPYSSLTEKIGYHSLMWLLLYCNKNNLQLPEILIHTQNIQGMKNMHELLAVYKSVK